MAVGVHPFPSRTRQLSPLALKILGWKRPGKISRCRHKQHPVIPDAASYSSLAQLVERSAVNRNVVGSSPTGGASLRKETQTEHRASGAPIVGVDGGGGTPVPIPNTAVKPTCVEDTWLEAARENRQMPTSQALEVVLLPGLVPYTEKSRKAA